MPDILSNYLSYLLTVISELMWRVGAVVRLLSCSDREPILLDWQFFGSGGPAIDIAYFFLMSLAPDPLLEVRNVIFVPCIYKNDHFAKTGSGQT